MIDLGPLLDDYWIFDTPITRVMGVMGAYSIADAQAIWARQLALPRQVVIAASDDLDTAQRAVVSAYAQAIAGWWWPGEVAVQPVHVWRKMLAPAQRADIREALTPLADYLRSQRRYPLSAIQMRMAWRLASASGHAWAQLSNAASALTSAQVRVAYREHGGSDGLPSWEQSPVVASGVVRFDHPAPGGVSWRVADDGAVRLAVLNAVGQPCPDLTYRPAQPGRYTLRKPHGALAADEARVMEMLAVVDA